MANRLSDSNFHISEITVRAEKQGSHSTPVNTSDMADLVQKYLLNTALSAITQDASSRMTVLIQSHKAVYTNLLELFKCPGCWVFQVEARHLPGNSHHGAGTLRAYNITSRNTLEVVIQPGDASSRRWGNLCLPKEFSGNKVQALEALLFLLAADHSYQSFGLNTGQAHREYKEELQHPETAERARRALRDFSGNLMSALRMRNNRAALLEKFLKKAGGFSIEKPELSYENALEVATEWRHSVRLRPQPQLAGKVMAAGVLEMAVMVHGLLDEDDTGIYRLGEYGMRLREEIQEASLRKEREAKIEQRNKAIKRKDRLTAAIASLQSDLQRKELELQQIEATLGE